MSQRGGESSQMQQRELPSGTLDIGTDKLHQIFKHHEDIRVLICKNCKHAVIPTNIYTHLSGIQHEGLQPKTRRAIAEAAQQLTEIAYTKEDVRYPAPTAPRISWLDFWEDGLKCLHRNEDGELCGLIRRTTRNMHWHCREAHGWKSKLHRGQRARDNPQITQEVMWESNIKCQQLFKTGGFQQLFEVEKDVPRTQEQNDRREMVVRAGLNWFEARVKEQKEARKAQVIDGTYNRYDARGWLETTAWPEHVDGLHRGWLRQLVWPPAEHEKGLARVCRKLEKVIFRAQEASERKKAGRAVLHLINLREFGGDPKNGKPFYTRQMSKTMSRYASHWIKVMRYIWRCDRIITSGEEESDESKRIPKFRFTEQQKEHLHKIKALVEADTPPVEEDDMFGATEGGPAPEEVVDEAASDSGSDSDDDGFDELELEILDFMIALLNHDSGGRDFKSVLISGLCILGINEQEGWAAPMDFTQPLSAVVTVARMVVICKAGLQRDGQIQVLSSQGYSREDADDEAAGYYDLVRTMAVEFMGKLGVSARPGPMDYVLHIKAYAMFVDKNQPVDGRLSWTGETVSDGKLSMSLSDLRSMVHGLTDTARKNLFKYLLLVEVDSEGEITARGREKLPVIKWDCIAENQGDMTIGFGIADIISSTAEDKNWLARHVVENYAEEFLDDDRTTADGPIAWKSERLEKYRQQLWSFREQLVMLVYLASGQSWRGSELFTLRHSNEAGLLRSMFMSDGIIEAITTYHKGRGMTGKDKRIHRFLPREVSELMVYYIWLVEPFWHTLEQFYNSAIPQNTLIWQRAAEKDIRPIGKAKRLRRMREEEQERALQIEQRGIDDATARVFEKQQLWNTAKLTAALGRLSQKTFGQRMTVNSWRHISIGMFRKFIDDPTVVKTAVQADDWNEEEAGEDEAFDLQAGHMTQTALTIYARLMHEARDSNLAIARKFRAVSAAWHHLLMFESAMLGTEEMEKAGESGRFPSTVRMMREVRLERICRWKQLRRVDIEVQVKRLLGDEAAFRGIQEPALRAIMRQQSRVIAIMRTGGGKSLLFMLPAFCSDGLTIVIVPLISLREDMKRRCDKAGIRCIEWDSARPHATASIVLVTPESAVSNGFARFMSRERAAGRLDRIVVDECHAVLDSNKKSSPWRRKMRQLRSLNCARVQIVYLTATLPPRQESAFMEIMGLPRLTDDEQAVREKYWFRDTTTRKNIAYRVTPIRVRSEDEEDAEAVGLVTKAKKKLEKGEQIVVYAGEVERVKRLAAKLGCPCYYRNVAGGSKDAKRLILERFRSGEEPILVATNALGLGIDIPGIRVVIHIGTIRDLPNYAQESGRAGRDGKQSKAIILLRQGREGPVSSMPRPKGVDEEMWEFITTDGCKRAVLDRVMDGRECREHGCEENNGEVACESCRRETDSESESESESESGCQVESVLGMHSEESEEEVAEDKVKSNMLHLQTQSQTSLRLGGLGRKRRATVLSEVLGDAESSAFDSNSSDAIDGSLDNMLDSAAESDEEEMDANERVDLRVVDRELEQFAIRENEHMQSLDYNDATLQERFVDWGNGCVWCRAQSKRGSDSHGLKQCTADGVEDGRQIINDMIRDSQQRRIWGRYSGCFKCGGTPQEICNAWVRIDEGDDLFKSSRRGCQYDNVLLAAVGAILLARDGAHDWVKEQARIAGIAGIGGGRSAGQYGMQQLLDWMGYRFEVGGMEANNACLILIQFGGDEVVNESDSREGEGSSNED